MQVGTGRSILNGIAIGKLKIYKKKDTVISTAEIADTAAEVARFEAAQQKAIEQQTALYEKALAEAGEDIAEVFNIHAMMLEDDDFVDAIKEIINGQHKCAEYAVKTAGDNQAAVFAAMDDPYLQARSADVIDIAQAILDILQGVDNASLQGTEPSILVAEDLAPSETVRMDKSLLLGFIMLSGIGVLGGSYTGMSVAKGLLYVSAALPTIIVGPWSAIRQARASIASINLVSKRPDQFGNSMLFPAMVETYAIFALLIST